MARKIVYRLQVSATMPLTDDAESTDTHTLESATTPQIKRAIERNIFNILKRSDYDCDVELMDFSVEDE
jgi:hypothetical protein